MEKKNLERSVKDRRGLENISNLFLSTGDNAKENLHQEEDQYPVENQCEVEETVSVYKKLAFQNDENVQQNMLETLTKHLEEGYDLKRIELQKNEDISKARGKFRKEEEVIIFIKDPLSP
jgi:galactokinase/mevalonate kinase-like predicted kinase